MEPTTNEKIDFVKQQLLTNPKLLMQQKEKFENAFGKDSETRTPKQWRRLVKVYGMKLVCNTEKLTKKQIKVRCSGRKV